MGKRVVRDQVGWDRILVDIEFQAEKYILNLSVYIIYICSFLKELEIKWNKEYFQQSFEIENKDQRN